MKAILLTFALALSGCSDCGDCCVECRGGCPCGDSCIDCDDDCTKIFGCACAALEEEAAK